MSTICTPLPGYYSDGNVIVQVGSNGIILATIDPSTCIPVGPSLTEYPVSYAPVKCDACCTGTAVVIFTDNTTLSTSTIAYNSSDGLTFAAPGFYALYDNTWIEVGVNGVILQWGTCDCVCGDVSDCNTYTIKNLTSNPINYSYWSCSDGQFWYGTLYGYGWHTTNCVLPGGITVTGQYQLDLSSSCGSAVSTYCIDGYWEVDDPQHPAGGSITYIDTSGDPVTLTGIWLGDMITFDGTSIVTKTGVALIDCSEIPEPVSCTTYTHIASRDSTIYWTSCDGIPKSRTTSRFGSYVVCAQTGSYSGGAGQWITGGSC